MTLLAKYGKLPSVQKPVVFKSDRFELYGVLHLPYRMSEKKPVPGVIFCHGFTGTKVEAHRMFVKMARLLEKHRIASLRFDFRGCGDSSGYFSEMTVMGEVEDAQNAVDFLCLQPGIDRNRIGLVGLSLGAVPASYVAGRDPRIHALALWAPAADLTEEAEQLRTQREIKIIKRLKAVDYYGLLLGKEFVEEIPKIDPLIAIKKYRGSAIIIHGTNDESVPLSHSERYYEVLRNKRCPVERHLIAGANHVFESFSWEQEVINRTLKFFVKNL